MCNSDKKTQTPGALKQAPPLPSQQVPLVDSVKEIAPAPPPPYHQNASSPVTSRHRRESSAIVTDKKKNKKRTISNSLFDHQDDKENANAYTRYPHQHQHPSNVHYQFPYQHPPDVHYQFPYQHPPDVHYQFPYQHPPNVHYQFPFQHPTSHIKPVEDIYKTLYTSLKKEYILVKEEKEHQHEKQEKIIITLKDEIELLKQELLRTQIKYAKGAATAILERRGNMAEREEEYYKMKNEMKKAATEREEEYYKMKNEMKKAAKQQTNIITSIKHKHHSIVMMKQALYAATTTTTTISPPSLSNSTNNSKSRPKKVGINEDKTNELKEIMETITTMQKKCVMDAGAKKEDVDVLVKSSFYLVGPPGVPPTTIMHSSYITLGEIHSTETNNVCMQTCHQNLKDESYIMVDHWQMANENVGTGMGEKNSLIKAFGQSGADQVGLLEEFLSSVKDKVNIVSMGNCALSGNLGALSDVHVSHTQNLVNPASGYNHLFALYSWVELVQLLRDVDEREAFIHVTSSVYKALALCSQSPPAATTMKIHDDQELYEAQVLALVSAKPALQKCRDTNTRTWKQFRP